MAQQRMDEAMQKIPHDSRAVDRGIVLRDEKYAPCMCAALIAVLVLDIAFGFLSMTRTYQHLGAYHTCAILYSVLMGIAVAFFSLVDMLYTCGFIGLRAESMPHELYRVMRRFCTGSYIRPRVYYDDRIPRNIAAIWTMRVLVPGLYALSLIVLWGIADDSGVSPDTAEGARFVMGNVLLTMLCFIHGRAVATNVYSITRKWDYVPLTPEDAYKPAAASAADKRK